MGAQAVEKTFSHSLELTVSFFQCPPYFWAHSLQEIEVGVLFQKKNLIETKKAPRSKKMEAFS
ncbi:hypothetical protein GCM10020331_092450 [Ectobacillus funiculus]